MTHTTDLGLEGATLGKEGHYLTAEQCLRLADPSPENLFNLANCQRRLGKYSEALANATRAAAIGGRPEIQHLLGCIHYDMGNPISACELLDPIKHMHHFWRFSYALACLAAGRWEEGFHHYDARLFNHSQPLPMWEGEPMNGQQLVVVCEQGLGDSIMFSRFREMLPGPVQFLAPNILVRLLGASSGNAAAVGWRMVPLMSVPNRLGLKEPPPAPKICPLERFELPRLADTRLNVGLVWRSKAGGFLRKPHEIEHGEQKTVPLRELMPLLGIPGCRFYSLQVEGDKDIGELGAGPLLRNLGPQIMDFADLAAFMAEMDVIVTCDTGPAHLAGAMGKPTIVMSPYNVAWQWQPQKDGKSVWYPSVEVIRQQAPGAWGPVVEEVGRRLS